MYKLNDKFQTQDLGKALLDETGIFEAISPSGQHFRVEARQGHSIVSLTESNNTGNWQCHKVAELTNPTQARAAGAGGN